jgi:hypothetical protein
LKSLVKVLLFVVASFVILAIFLLYQFFSIPNKVTDEIQSKACTGIIRSIEKTRPCFVNLLIKETNKTIDLGVMNCCGSEKNSFFDYAEVGDSLIKEKGKLRLLIIKANNHGKKEFSYPLCFK